MTRHAAKAVEPSPNRRGFLSHWIRSANERDEQPAIDQAMLLGILREHSVPSVAEQADRLLYWLGQQLLELGNPAARVSLKEHRRIAALIGAFPEPGGALMYVVKELAKREFIFPTEISQYADQIGLTFDG